MVGFMSDINDIPIVRATNLNGLNGVPIAGSIEVLSTNFIICVSHASVSWYNPRTMDFQDVITEKEMPVSHTTGRSLKLVASNSKAAYIYNSYRKQLIQVCWDGRTDVVYNLEATTDILGTGHNSNDNNIIVLGKKNSDGCRGDIALTIDGLFITQSDLIYRGLDDATFPLGRAVYVAGKIIEMSGFGVEYKFTCNEYREGEPLHFIREEISNSQPNAITRFSNQLYYRYRRSDFTNTSISVDGKCWAPAPKNTTIGNIVKVGGVYYARLHNPTPDGGVYYKRSSDGYCWDDYNINYAVSSDPRHKQLMLSGHGDYMYFNGASKNKDGVVLVARRNIYTKELTGIIVKLPDDFQSHTIEMAISNTEIVFYSQIARNIASINPDKVHWRTIHDWDETL